MQHLGLLFVLKRKIKLICTYNDNILRKLELFLRSNVPLYLCEVKTISALLFITLMFHIPAHNVAEWICSRFLEKLVNFMYIQTAERSEYVWIRKLYPVLWWNKENGIRHISRLHSALLCSWINKTATAV